MTIDQNNRRAMYRSVFKDNAHGEEVLQDIEDSILRTIRLDSREISGKPNPNYMNPNSALAQALMLTVVDRIRGIINDNAH